MWWQYTERFIGDHDPSRRIADVGKTLLLGWDIMRERSIIVKPETAVSKLETMLKEAQGWLTDFCVLSRDA